MFCSNRFIVRGLLAIGTASLCAAPALAAAYTDAVLATPGLSGYWRLSETVNSGTLTTWADSSGNGHTGTQTIHPARVPTLNQPGPRPSDGFLGFESGNIGETFNRSQAILIADAADINPGTGDFTMEGWAKATTNSNLAVLSIMGKDNGSYNNGYLLCGNYNDYANHDTAARVRDGTGSSIDPGAAIQGAWGTGATWHHVVGVFHRTGNGSSYADSGLSIFLDGNLVGSFNSTVLDGKNITTTRELGLGAANRDSNFGFVGSLDEFAVYHRALSPEEVSAHWTAAVTGVVPEPASAALAGLCLLAARRRK